MQLMIREDVERKVAGAILLKPSCLLSSEVNLTPNDFTNRLNKIIVGTVSKLTEGGLATISEKDVSDYIKNYKTQYEYYVANDGPTAVEEMIKEADPDNFKYYYKTLKKVTLINNLIIQKFDVSYFYDPEEVNPAESEKIQKRFEEATVSDIIGYYEKTLMSARRDSASSQEKMSQQAGVGLAELVSDYTKAPDIGLPTNSKKLNTLFRGRRFGKFYIYSSVQGGGKSRLAMGDAARIALKKIYNPITKEWEVNSNPQGVLYIATEMEINELQSMLLAYATGINESQILTGNYSLEDRKVINEGIKVIEDSPIYLEYMSSFTISDIEEEIKLYKQQYDIKALFFDYISLNMKSSYEIANKMGIRDMREDQVLLIFSERLKILANEYNIHVASATQLNGEWETKETPNQNLLRGSKAISDKADIACIVLPPNKTEEGVIESLKEKYEYTPNMVFHIYKIRQGNYQKNTKVFVYFDYGTCRTHDCFVTDKKNNLINVDDTEII